MKVSVIIPSYNGAHKVVNLLATLEKQTHSDFEVIVVVDGSTDGTAECIHSQQYALKNLLVLEQSNGGRAVARNAGAQRATGDLLIFFDDDVLPLPDCVAQHRAHHLQFPNTLLVGLVRQDERLAEMNDFLAYRDFIEEQWRTAIQAPFFQVGLENYLFTTQNLSLSKSTFQQLGGFDIRLNDSEDFDLSMRAFQKDFSIYYSEKVFVWHYDLATFESYINRQRQYALSKKYLSQIRPNYLAMHPASFRYHRVRWHKKWMGRLFIYSKGWKYILHADWFRKFTPRRVRYKLYSLLIYANSILHPTRYQP